MTERKAWCCWKQTSSEPERMKSRGFILRFMALAVLSTAAVSVLAAPSLHLENNQPFPIQMPVTIRDSGLGDGEWTANGRAVQTAGANATLVIDLARGAQQDITFKQGKTVKAGAFALKRAPDGVELIYSGKELGQLSWGIFLKPAKPVPAEEGAATHEDFDTAFAALPLQFQHTGEGPVFDTWTAEAPKAGLRLKLTLLAYHEGFLDLSAQLTNAAAERQTNVYAAVICRWQQPRLKSRTLCYDNRISTLGEKASSPFRAGEGRHQFTQRGVDWVRGACGNGVTAAWLNDFAPSFTLLDNTAKNTFKQPRYEGANLPQLGQEVQTAGNKFYSITEIARSNIQSYRDRLAESTLPARGDSIVFSSRLGVGEKAIERERTRL